MPLEAEHLIISVLMQNKHLADLRRQDGLAHERLTGMYSLLYGAIAGGTAESVVYPLIVVQRRMQLATMQAAQQAGRTDGAALAQKRGLAMMRSAAIALYKAHGLRGFYIGYLPNILQVWRLSVAREQWAERPRHRWLASLAERELTGAERSACRCCPTQPSATTRTRPSRRLWRSIEARARRLGMCVRRGGATAVYTENRDPVLSSAALTDVGATILKQVTQLRI